MKEDTILTDRQTDRQICIIIPVFNAKDYLDRCIESILAQTKTDFELVLIDDGSTDGSGEICENYSQRDSRIIVFHQQNSGQSKARNVGLDYVFSKESIDYISFVDSDDVVSPKYLEILHSALVSEQSDLCIANYIVLNENDEFRDDTDNCTFESSEDLESFWLEHNSPTVWGKLYKKRIFEGVRYPEGVIFEDEATTYKTVFGCKRITFCSAVVYGYYRYHPHSTMNKGDTPYRHEMWLNSFKHQMDFYYINDYNRLFGKYYCFYTNHIQQLVIDYWKNEEYECFFKKIIADYRKLPLEYPIYFETRSLKGEYFRIYKKFKSNRYANMSQDYLTVKQQKGKLYAVLHYVYRRTAAVIRCLSYINRVT